MRSFGEILDDHKGLAPGFDFVRIALAIAIVATHSLRVLGATWYFGTPLWFIDYSLVAMFFALSGFLITGSALRLSLKNFLINRGLRIVPALTLDIFVCALVIGPLMTTLPWSEYFTGTSFFTYFLNIVGWIHYSLPGVFEHYPLPQVNGSLWTVPWEIGCYATMSGLIILKWVKSTPFVLLVLVAYLALGAVFEYTPVLAHAPRHVANGLLFLTTSRGTQLISAFLVGILAYQLRYHIPYSRTLLALSCFACLVGALLLDRDSLSSVGGRPFLLPALVYITIFLGMTRIPIPGYFHRGDYSYGIYLYHMPLLQVVATIFPSLALIPYFGWMILFVLGIPVVVLFATFSWHTVEKPILNLRKKFSFVARARGVEVNGNAGGPAPLPEDRTAMAGAPAAATSASTS